MRVVVIGGGAMGCAATWALARRGAPVLMVERFQAGHDRGGSHGNARIFRFAYPDADYVRLAQSALPLWRRLEQAANATLIETTGGIDHGDASTLSAVAAALESAGARFELLPAVEASRRWPGMRFAGDVLHQPDAGRIDADATLAALVRIASAAGAAIRYEEPALAIRETADDIVVETPTGTHHADVAIIACGAWTPNIAGHLLPLPPLAITEEQPAHFRPRDPTQAWPSFIHHRVDAHAAYGLGAAGEGVKVGEHFSGRSVDPDARPEDDDTGALARLSTYVGEWLPGLDPAPVSWTHCLYDTTAGEDFVIDRRGRLVVVAGTSGHGFKFVPVIGEILADLALGGEQSRARFRLG